MFIGDKQRPATGKEAEQLLELFGKTVPLLPRKLIRAADLLDFLNSLPKHFQADKLLLARLVLLQLFASEVFRHLRRTNIWLLKIWAEWQKEAGKESSPI